MFRNRLITVLALGAAIVGCSRGGDGASGTESEARVTPAGSEEAVERVQTAARALAEPNPSVDYVAAQMKGVIKGRTSSQALIHYDGYRATFTTPGDRVTRIQFDFVEAKPTMSQLTAAFGTPEEVARGLLYRHEVGATGGTIRVLAEPVSKPATETSMVRRILVEGDKFR